MAVRRVEIRVSVDDLDANKRLDALAAKLDKLTKRVWNVKLRLDDGGFGARLDKMAARLDKISKQTISPKFDLRGVTAANAQIDRLNARLDRLSRRSVTANVGVDGAGAAAGAGLLGRLFGGGGAGGAAGAAAAGAAGGGGILATLGKFFASPIGVGVGLTGLPSAAALFDALAGMGVGTLGAGGAFALATHFDKAQVMPGLGKANNALNMVGQSIAPSIGVMLAGLGQFVKSDKIPIAQMFSAALPFIQQFINLLEIAAKNLLPAFTSAMKTMVSSGALTAMTQGFAFIIQGIAGFIKALGPGFKAGALTFRAIAMGIRGVLYGLGTAFGKLGEFAGMAYHAIHDWWDKLRNHTAVIFDGIRHDVAHIWDMIWNNTFARVGRGVQDVINWDERMRHGIANIYDGVRHDISSAWDTIWNNTVGRVERGVHDVTSWFGKLPGDIQNVLKGLGNLLYSIGKSILNDFLNGLKAVAGPILGFVRGIASAIGGILGSIGGAISSVGSGISRVTKMAQGGIISEPIIGQGLRTGMTYTFGEGGIQERVTPLGSGGGGGNTYISIMVNGDTDPDGAALQIIQKIRGYKIRHGNAILGIG